jgi:SAM-dependent methyltransferase
VTHEAIRRYYDRIGRGQDTQRFYEDPAVRRLRERGQFGEAQRVVELGCGTGRLARTLLGEYLPASATYRGFELSERMATISTDRLRPWSGRATVTVVDGDPPLPLPDGSADRFVATYVLDLMRPADARRWLDEVRRILATGALACLVSITPGTGRASRIVSETWTRIWRRRPMLVGGCRPIELTNLLDVGDWDIVDREVVTAWLVSSEVVIARRR